MTERVRLDDGTWFDSERAEAWDEDARYDGRNSVSQATGSPWEHQRLYRSVRGTWVLHNWSEWEDSKPSYDVIGEEDAHAWLLSQGHSDAVPSDVLAASEV